MIDILIKILGHALGLLVLLGLIVFIVDMFKFMIAAADGRVRFIFPYWFVVLDKVKKPKAPGKKDEYDPRKEPLRVAPHSHSRSSRRSRRQRPEWLRFIMEESIDSLLEKRRQRRAALTDRNTAHRSTGK